MCRDFYSREEQAAKLFVCRRFGMYFAYKGTVPKSRSRMATMRLNNKVTACRCSRFNQSTVAGEQRLYDVISHGNGPTNLLANKQVTADVIALCIECSKAKTFIYNVCIQQRHYCTNHELDRDYSHRAVHYGDRWLPM